MPTKKYKLLSPDTPLIFSDGTEVYEKLGQEYIQHKKGYFIMAPSGAGKTYFVERQSEKHWLDGDDIWQMANAHPNGEWWLEPIPVIDEIDQRCDVITQQAKKLGFWIVGASNYWLKPDAIVIPDWETHKKYISAREKGVYDGGATSERHQQVLNHREWIIKWVEKGVPQFESMQEAAAFLEAGYELSKNP